MAVFMVILPIHLPDRSSERTIARLAIRSAVVLSFDCPEAPARTAETRKPGFQGKDYGFPCLIIKLHKLDTKTFIRTFSDMIGNNTQFGTHKVTLHGRILLPGRLFKSRSSSRKESALDAFASPRVRHIRHGADPISQEKGRTKPFNKERQGSLRLQNKERKP